ncbi:hypothetical protein [Luteibacter sp. 329MFSha]|uniref:hypothetical protein n=1 Tax=Luteibacter sp. 329MFSha TaxID=1798239 RepID=UPI0008C3ADB4|nr:hypothetical protein [Luteibacter sp. 329MFSha]SEW13456.1 hypothetical protein SAMN04515660_2436 [Luteibacter sp. 329MFSha]
MNQEKQDADRPTGPDDRWVASMRAWEAMRSPWAKERPAFVRCYVCHPENDEIDPEDGLRPSQLRPIHKCTYVDPGQEQYLRATAEQLREKKDEDVHEWPEPGYDFGTGLRRKPMSRTRPDLRTPPHEEPIEDDAMKRRKMAMAAALAAGAAMPAPSMHVETKQPANEAVASKKTVAEPVWPNNGIAQREVGNGEEWAENFIVEHVDGKWTAWAVARPAYGETKGKALDFFTGEVLEVTGELGEQYIDSFVDAKGVEHKDTSDKYFYFKDGRPGGAAGKNIDFSSPTIEVSRGPKQSVWLNTYQRRTEDHSRVIWSKVPMYRCASCPDDDWASLLSTAIELRDGTMLISAGKYVFRVRTDDLSPVGEAPALHIFEESEVQRAIDDAKALQVQDVLGHVLKALRLD